MARRILARAHERRRFQVREQPHRPRAPPSPPPPPTPRAPRPTRRPARARRGSTPPSRGERVVRVVRPRYHRSVTASSVPQSASGARSPGRACPIPYPCGAAGCCGEVCTTGGHVGDPRRAAASRPRARSAYQSTRRRIELRRLPAPRDGRSPCGAGRRRGRRGRSWGTVRRLRRGSRGHTHLPRYIRPACSERERSSQHASRSVSAASPMASQNHRTPRAPRRLQRRAGDAPSPQSPARPCA